MASRIEAAEPKPTPPQIHPPPNSPPCHARFCRFPHLAGSGYAAAEAPRRRHRRQQGQEAPHREPARRRGARLAHLLLRPLESPAAGAGGLPPPHEEALHSLGLLNFARLDMHSDAPRPDLVAYYDPVCKCSFVHGVRVTVSRLGAFSVLKELVIVLPDCLADNFGSVIPRIEKALNDKSSTSTLKKYWNAS
ncbi:unnamed protein product [Urochloa humidicola]